MKISITPRNLDKLKKKFGDTAEEAAKNLAKDAKDEWLRLANEELLSTKRPYKDAIKEPRRVGEAEYVIELGTAPNRPEGEKHLGKMVERGFRQISAEERIRQMLKGRPKLIVPIRERTENRKDNDGFRTVVPFSKMIPDAPERQDSDNNLLRQLTVKDPKSGRRRKRKLWELPARKGKNLHKKVMAWIRKNAKRNFIAAWEES